MKILNIDAFAPPKRKLSLGDVSYPVKDIDVQSFIDNLAMAEALEKAGEASHPGKQIELSIQMIENAIPTAPAGAFKKLSIEQIGVILAFIRGEMDAEATDEAEEGSTEKKPD